MPSCEMCGNEYDKPIQVVVDGASHTFDSFECAIQKLAPECPRCGLKIIGHGVEDHGSIFCCANCARRHEGATALKDRA